MTHRKKYPLRATDFDKYLRIKPSVVLELFQDVASEHAESFGAGYKEMKDKGLMWVIIKTKYQMIKDLERYSTIEVETWPLKSNGLVFRREYLIKNSEGEICVRGSSDWAIVNAVERKIAVVKDVYRDLGLLREDLAIDGKAKKIQLPSEFDYQNTVSFAFSSIDQNHHVNNVCYATQVIDGLRENDSKIASFQIDYHKEIMENESINLYYKNFQNHCVITGKKESGELSFNCKIEY